MDNYSVKKLSRLAGVSVRTLHLYDKMGLLKPSVRTEARYRLYGEKELLRLQQILFYRELDFPLKEIEMGKLEYFRKLGELYVADNRYTPVNGMPSKELALFIKEATDHYIKKQQQ